MREQVPLKGMRVLGQDLYLGGRGPRGGGSGTLSCRLQLLAPFSRWYTGLRRRSAKDFPEVTLHQLMFVQKR